MNINAERYLKWLEEEGFRDRKLGITWIDLEFLIKDVLQAYKVPMDYGLAKMLEDEFVEVHLDGFYDTLVYKREHKETGKIAVQMIKNDYEWNRIETELQYMDMLNRCVLYKFKNSRYVKELMKKYKLKLQN